MNALEAESAIESVDRGPLRVDTVKNTDHVFTLKRAQDRLVKTIEQWMTTGQPA